MKLGRLPGCGEAIRCAGLTAMAVLAVLPFLTGRLIGGVDARWYALMLKGFTDQIRWGHWPMLIGQGPTAWNGGVHPFRSAPVYLLVGGLWKVLTASRLGPYWLEHLTVVTSAVIGTLGFYRAAVLLRPDRRWVAAAFAALYVCCPAWLSTIYKAEAYMSYMAFAVIPLVLYGNARTLQAPGGRGYVPLGMGLALLWMCHPPIALLTTLVTAFVQMVALAQQGLGHWRAWARGGAIFACLAAYYFATMSELPPRPDSGVASHAAILWLGGMVAFGLGLGRAAFYRGHWSWLGLSLAGLGLLAVVGHGWPIWAAITGGLCLAVACAVRHSERREAWALAIMVGAGLAAAAIAALVIVLPAADPNPGVLLRARLNVTLLHGLLAPLPGAMDGDAIFQPGWAVDAALLVGVGALGCGRSAEAAAFGAAALLLTISFFLVPGVTPFLLSGFPSAFAAIISLPLPHRVLPVLSSVALMAAVLAAAKVRTDDRRGRWALAAVLGLALAWSVAQLYPIIRIGYLLTSTAPWSTQSLRPENMLLDRYAYDLLHVPDYFCNGVSDPGLESRFLRLDGSMLIGPDQMAAAAATGASRRVRLVGQPIPGSTSWFDVVPKLDVGPGEHLLFRYEFDPRQNYTGFMIFSAEDGYREYQLPAAGQPLAFGIGSGHTAVLSFWNSGHLPEHYRLVISQGAGNSLDSHGGFFANVLISALDQSRLPIRLESFDPYRAAVDAPEAGLLETFRVMLPGYHVTVDGHPVSPQETKQGLLAVAVPAGTHEVVVRFVGSARLWLGLIVTLGGWCALGWGWARSRRAGPAY